MNKVWVLSEGERYEGESVLGIYSDNADAVRELEAIAERVSIDIQTEGDKSVLDDGTFYHIIRPMEVL
jgi:hypothetical protein